LKNKKKQKRKLKITKRTFGIPIRNSTKKEKALKPKKSALKRKMLKRQFCTEKKRKGTRREKKKLKKRNTLKH